MTHFYPSQITDAAVCVITFFHSPYVIPSTSLPTLPWPV